MGIKVDPKKCVSCMACEMACGYHRDDGFALLSSCIMVTRGREKRDYSGVVLKEAENLVIARPEGLEIRRIGAVGEEAGADQSKGDASAKPLLLRQPCDLCSDREEGPLCLQFCPVNAISMD
jgi:Fe-S-cluster-containing dehydrogenase component